MAKNKPATGPNGEVFLTEQAGDAGRRERLRSLTMAQKREALAGRKGLNVTKLSDEQVETLWTSLDDEQRLAYLES